MSETRAHLVISGRVQGVLFRDTLRRKAKRHDVVGWVRNISDGKVEAVLEGDKENITQVIAWARKGPMFANVTDITVEWQEYQGTFQDFRMHY